MQVCRACMQVHVCMLWFTYVIHVFSHVCHDFLFFWFGLSCRAVFHYIMSGHCLFVRILCCRVMFGRGMSCHLCMQHYVMWCDVAPCNVTWLSVIDCGVMWRSVVLCSVGVALCNVMRCHEMWSKYAMYVCMCVCIYVCMLTYVYVCMYVCNVCMWCNVCMYVCVHVCMYVCMYVCMHACNLMWCNVT